MYFKDKTIYLTQPDKVCYIPEHAEDDEPGLTRNDFIELCGGDRLKADIVFDICSWEHPATILYQWDEDDEEALQELREREREKKTAIKVCETCAKRSTCTKDIGIIFGFCNTDYEPDFKQQKERGPKNVK